MLVVTFWHTPTADIKRRCAAHVDGKPLYSDDDHLSSFGAGLVLEKIIEHL